MNGIKYILDTSTLISFFNGNAALRFLTSTPVGIKEIEVFYLKKEDRELIDRISSLKRESKIKLPDTIIAATAILNNAILITNDKGFSYIPLLQTVSF
ncbi:PIN domain-containing protein [Segetibacter sp.]|jgi:predicted nucleic acid-binding protein|uniref:PIN domain-containing protein n=1 Tax=Segetibacter sp. TaxID=2231182 RepID=UPI002618983F|nr:PIN domain-containing protein [Segetibacter sp.]MCW3080085.1 Twitching motility protein PilT [Segetibacter sp.]